MAVMRVLLLAAFTVARTSICVVVELTRGLSRSDAVVRPRMVEALIAVRRAATRMLCAVLARAVDAFQAVWSVVDRVLPHRCVLLFA